MAIVLRGAYKQLVGPKEAETLLSDYAYPRQRSVSMEHVERLAGMMTGGTFLPGTTIKLVYLGENVYLVDGQHRLHAVRMSGVPIEFAIADFDVDTEDEVAGIYGHTDYALRARTVSVYMDAMNARERLGLQGMQINALSAAVPLMLAGGDQMPLRLGVTLEERMRIVELYAPHMVRFYSAAGRLPSGLKKSLMRSYVQLFAALTMRWPTTNGSRTTADFWHGVIHDDGVAADDPRKHLNRSMMLAKVVSSKNAYGSGSNLINPIEGFRMMTIGYNAYLKGRALKFIRVNGAGEERMAIAGVPADHAEWSK